jgi:hypothetical protein
VTTLAGFTIVVVSSESNVADETQVGAWS